MGTDKSAAVDEPTPVAVELDAMRRIVVALDRLDATTQDRVANWIFDRYHHPSPDPDEASWSP